MIQIRGRGASLHNQRLAGKGTLERFPQRIPKGGSMISRANPSGAILLGMILLDLALCALVAMELMDAARVLL